jgi:ribosomal-protein-alanine N-acetyltransferase
MRLREYDSADLGAIFALDEVCFEAPFRFSARAMRQFVEARNALTVVAEAESGDIEGFCIAHVERTSSGPVAYVVTLDVAPQHRRRGLARKMMKRIEQEARVAGCVAMDLHVSVENGGAIVFYESVGYQRMQRVSSFYGAGRDAFLYWKALERA